MARMFTFDSGSLSLEVSRELSIVEFRVIDGARVRMDKQMGIREMFWLLQVTPQMLRGLADELEPANKEAVS